MTQAGVNLDPFGRPAAPHITGRPCSGVNAPALMISREGSKA